MFQNILRWSMFSSSNSYHEGTTMVHLATILHRTPSNIHHNSQNCRSKITSATMSADARGSFQFIKAVGIDPTTTKKAYRIIAKLYVDKKTGKPPKNPEIWVHCGCSWFKFNAEVALAVRGSSSVINSNGALAKITNPTSKPVVCKHVLSFFKTVRSAPMKIETIKKKATVKDVHADNKLQSTLDNSRSGKLSASQKRANSEALDVNTKQI